MPDTKASLLRFSIAFALSSVKVRIGRQFHRLGLTEEQRHEVARNTVDAMRQHGQWKDLDDPVDPPRYGPR
jgi:hypothetical protein